MSSRKRLSRHHSPSAYHQINISINSHHLLLFFWLLWLATFCLYFYTAGRTATGYADSDELLTMAYSWAIPHPSGFPLLVFVTGAMMRLFYTVSPALIGNLMGSLFQSLSIAAMGSIIVILGHLIPKKYLSSSPSKRPFLYLSAFLGSLAISLSGMYWLYGSALEVVSLTNALISLTLLFAFIWYQRLTSGLSHHSWFYLTILLSGIALSHIHTTILMYPGLLVLLVLTFKKYPLEFQKYRHPLTLFKALLSWIVGFIFPNLLLFFLNSRQQMYSWYLRPGISGWLRLILRQDYAGYFPEEGTSRSAYLADFTHNFILGEPALLKYLWTYLTPIGIILAVVGIIFIFKRHRLLGWVIALCWLVAGPIFLGYMGFPAAIAGDPEYAMSVGITYRQFLIAHWFTGLLSVTGLVYLCDYLSWRLPSWIVSLSKLGLLLLVLIFYAVTFYPLANQRHNQIAADYAANLLVPLKPNSLLISSSDLSTFALFYAQTVNHLRPDVTVLTKNDLYTRRFLHGHQEMDPFSYTDNPFYLANLVAYNLLSRPVYLANPTQYYIDYLGLDGNPFYLIPYGYVYEVVKTVPPSLNPQYDASFSTNLLRRPTSLIDYYLHGLNGYFASLHETNGILLAKYGFSQEAKQEFQLAIGLYPESPHAAEWLTKIDHLSPEPEYLPGAKTDLATLLLQFDESLTAGLQADAYEIIRKATYLDPQNSEARFRLAKIYEAGNYPDEAIRELRHLLLFDPQNASASAELTNLKVNP
jgi:tetratricopeptide (TPR) repeat protein